MKMTSIFKKASVIAIAITLILLMVLSILPAAVAADSTEPVLEEEFNEKLSASNISLSGSITLMYYFKGLEDFAPGDYIKITIPQEDGSDKVITRTKYWLEYNGKYDEGKQRWLVEVPIAYAQQNDKITMQWFRKVDGVEKGGKVRVKTVRDYYDAVVDSANKGNAKHQELIAPLKSMLNAGAMAQTYFGHNSDNLANTDLFVGGSNPVNDMTAEHFYDVTTRTEYENKGTGIEFLGGSALLQSSIGLRIYLSCPDEITTATIYKGDRNAVGVQSATVKIRTDDSNGKKFVAITNILATQFDTRFTVEVMGQNGENAYFEYSVLDYALNAMNNYLANEALKNTAKSLYLFYANMKDYTDDNYVPGPKVEDESGKLVVVPCTHERTHLESSNIVCSDCGDILKKEDASTKLTVTVNAPVVRAGEEATITVTYAISNALDLRVLSLKSKLGDVNLTFAKGSIVNGEGYECTVDENVIIESTDAAGAFVDNTTLVTVTYTVTIPEAGMYKLSTVINEAATSEGDLDDAALATIITNTPSIEVKPAACDEHNTQYIDNGKSHIAHCPDCKQVLDGDEAHTSAEKWSPVIENDGNKDGVIYETKLCTLCGGQAETRAAAVRNTVTNYYVNGKNYTRADLNADPSLRANTYTFGFAGWIVINGGTERYVYRVYDENGNVSAWKTAVYTIAPTDLTANNTAHIEIVEREQPGFDNYYKNVLFHSGIHTEDLQDYVGQTIEVEFAAVPANNPGIYEAPNTISIGKVGAITVACDHSRNTNDRVQLENDPQYEQITCSVCGTSTTRFIEAPDGLTFFNPSSIGSLANNYVNVDNTGDDEGMHFVRFTAKAAGQEGYLFLTQGPKLENVGRYVAMMVRKNSASGHSVELFTTAVGQTAPGSHKNHSVYIEVSTAWQFVLFDLGAAPYTSIAGLDLNDGLGWTRIDIFNGTIAAGDKTDVAWVGFFDNANDARELYTKYIESYNINAVPAACVHAWVDATCTTPKTCSVCNATEGAALGHTWVDADCDTPKTCSVCSATEGAALGHAFTYTATDVFATYNVGCSRCDYTETKSGINHEGLAVLDADRLAGSSYINAADNKTPCGHVTKYTSTFYNGLEYVDITSTGQVDASFVNFNIPGGATNVGNYVAIIYRSWNINNSGLYVDGAKATAVNAWNTQAKTWQMMVYDLSEISELENGVSTIRFDIGTNMLGRHIEIAYISFFSSEDEANVFYSAAAEEYKLTEDEAGGVYRVHYNSVSVNGSAISFSNTLKNLTHVYDLAGTASVSKISPSGWFMTYSGTKNYKYVITDANGNKVIGTWVGGDQFAQGYTDAAVGLGLGDTVGTANDCRKGAACSVVLDNELLAFAGKTVTVELYAETNDGRSILFSKFINVNVSEDNTYKGNFRVWYRAAIDVGGNAIAATQKNDGTPLVFDLTGKTLKTPTITLSDTLNVIESGVQKYVYVIIDENGNEQEVEYAAGNRWATNKDIPGIAAGIGILTSDLVDCRRGAQADKTIDLTEFDGQNVTVQLYAINYFGQKILITQFNNVKVPELDPVYDGAFRTHYDSVNVNGVKFTGGSKVSETYIIDLKGYTLVDATSLSTSGWFIVESGTAKYVYTIIDAAGNKTDREYTGSNLTTNDTLAGIANGLGISSSGEKDSRLGAGFGKTFDLSGFEGQTVTVKLYAITNDGDKVLSTVFNNVTIAAADPVYNGKYKTYINGVYVNSKLVVNAGGYENKVFTANFSGKTLETATSLELSGWFIVDSGTKNYICRVYDKYGNAKDIEYTTSDITSQGHKDATTAYGLDPETALLNGSFSKVLDLTGYEGQTVTIKIYSVSNNGDTVLSTVIKNVTIAAQ